MSDQAALSLIEADLVSLRARVDALNDPRLDGVSGRLLGALSALRPISRPAAVERFGR